MKNVTVKDFTRKLELELLKVTLISVICIANIVSVGFTGIDSAYEPPVKPELVLKSGEWSVDECVEKVIQMLRDHVRVL